MISLFIENKKLENDNIYTDDNSTYTSKGFLLHYKHTKTHTEEVQKVYQSKLHFHKMSALQCNPTTGTQGTGEGRNIA